jgi:hypothetical protein
MNSKSFVLAGAAAVALAGAASLVGLAAPAAGPVQFRAHDIDPKFPGGYSVSVADFNKDGKLDVITNSLSVSEVGWYENPTWTRHVIVPEIQQIVNQAMADIDGDGIPEIAFQSSFAMQAANSQGNNWIARSQGDPTKPWKAEKIDSFPTSHHVQWADLDGDGKKELINAPLIGEKSVAPSYDQDKASVFWYDTKTWKRHLVTDQIPGIIHRVRPIQWDTDRREEFLISSFEGIALYKSSGTGENMTFTKTLLSPGHNSEPAPRLGASDANIGMQDGKRFLASVEPWHGNEVVVYTEAGGKWNRRVIFDKISSGHEIAVGDLNGDGRADIVANDNGRVTPRSPNMTPGVHVFYAPEDAATGEWKYVRLESEAAMNGCVIADMNNDRKNDIVCTGAGGVTRWYENLGAGAPSNSGR